MGLQKLVQFVLPHQCVGCGTMVADDRGLCGPCWAATPFIVGLVCDGCGLPLPGDAGEPAAAAPPRCDDCLADPRPWSRGRAAMLYRDNARRLVLALKHGDRLDLARPASRWMAAAATPILEPGSIAVPVPSHWIRLLRRRYNQAAILAQGVARLTGIEVCPDALVRVRRTETQEGKGRDDRRANVSEAIRPHPQRGKRLAGRPVLLVDDVMTSGATLAASAEAALAAGASSVSVLVLARVGRDA